MVNNKSAGRFPTGGFQGKTARELEPFQNKDSSSCSSIIRNSKQQTQHPSKSLKEPHIIWAKGRRYTTGKVIQCFFNIDLYTYIAIYRYRWSKWWVQYIYYKKNNRLHTYIVWAPCDRTKTWKPEMKTTVMGDFTVVGLV